MQINLTKNLFFILNSTIQHITIHWDCPHYFEYKLLICGLISEITLPLSLGPLREV